MESKQNKNKNRIGWMNKGLTPNHWVSVLWYSKQVEYTTGPMFSSSGEGRETPILLGL
jgi:hypothetical protein